MLVMSRTVAVINVINRTMIITVLGIVPDPIMIYKITVIIITAMVTDIT